MIGKRDREEKGEKSGYHCWKRKKMGGICRSIIVQQYRLSYSYAKLTPTAHQLPIA